MKNIELSTHEIINGLGVFIIDEIDYNVDKLYMISEKLLESQINQKIFKFEKEYSIAS